MFSADVPSYVIDLERDEVDRWDEVIPRERDLAGKIVQEAAKHFERVPELVRWAFARLYQRSGGLYHGEIEAWARGLNVSVGTATILNCAYELSHLRWPKLKVFGCTAGVRWVNGLGMVHVRSLDWPLGSMGAASRLFRFRRGSREFISVGVPGQVGVLSGMLPHAYSVTINWAPPVAFPTFDFGPTFLLREALETCDSYDALVRMLTETKLSTSVFFTICGTVPGQACIIERTQNDFVVRPITESLVQANHHIAPQFKENNADILEATPGEEVFSLDGSLQRVANLTDMLAAIPADCNLDTAVAALQRPTVLNGDTCQQMVFVPGRGEIKVWRRMET